MPAYEPTERELEILKVLWSRKQATVREVCNALKEQGSDLAYTSVLSLLQIMERKGAVRHVRDGKAYRYLARVRKDSTLRRLAGGFVAKVFDGAVDEFVLRALEARNLDPSDLDRLEKLIEDSRRRAARGRREGEGDDD